MCVTFVVSPVDTGFKSIARVLLPTFPRPANKGFWAELLGVGDFYYELGIQIIEICLATRPINGGLIEMGELKRRVEKARGGTKEKVQEITEYGFTS